MNAYQCTQVAKISVLYHRRRQAFFEHWDLTAKVLALVSSAAVIYADKWGITWIAIAIAIATAVVTMGVVVGGATRKAVTHNTLAARWLDLEADLIKLGPGDEPEGLDKIRERMAQLRREELPEMGALIRLCHREVMRAEGFEEGDLPQVPGLHRWLCHWWDFQTPPSKPAI
jgi:hypothetical protein